MWRECGFEVKAMKVNIYHKALFPGILAAFSVLAGTACDDGADGGTAGANSVSGGTGSTPSANSSSSSESSSSGSGGGTSTKFVGNITTSNAVRTDFDTYW